MVRNFSLKLLKYFFIFIFTTLFAFLLVVFLKPSIAVNATTLQWLLKLYQVNEIHWRSLNIQSQMLGFWQRKVTVLGDEVCYINKEMTQICLDKVDFIMNLNLKKWNKKILALSNMQAQGYYNSPKQEKILFTVNCPSVATCQGDVSSRRVKANAVLSIDDIYKNPVHYEFIINNFKWQGQPWSLQKALCRGSFTPVSQFSTHCQLPFQLIIASDSATHRWLKRLQLPQQHHFDFKMDYQKDKALHIAVNMEPLQSPAFRAQAKIEGEVPLKKPSEDSDSFIKSLKKIKPEVQVEIFDFAKLVQLLKGTALEVIAPLHTLRGSISATLLPFFTNDNFGGVEFEGRSRLQDSRQKVHLLAKGRWQRQGPQSRPQGDLELHISELALQLPPLDPLYDLPRWSKPPHLAKQEDTMRTERGRYSVKINGKPQSVKLFYQYAFPFISLQPSLEWSNQSLRGNVQMDPVQFKYLNRTSFMEKLNIDWPRYDSEPMMNGRFRIEQGEYKIYLNVEGPLQKPQVSLESQPFLSQQDIIAVLLYGQPVEALSISQAESSSDFQAAVTHRAIGLLGVWIFASTPIQAVRYDPLTQSYSATVRLPGDSILEIGTDWEERRSVVFKKWLSQHWKIMAELENFEHRENMGQFFLEWERRY